MKFYKLGYTTGVFDMFHVGHLNILRRAKEHCEKLIVGVSTDELVKSYKHKVPIMPLEDRLEIVSAIKYVDKVIIQSDLDKFKAWEKLHFNAIFHGDDWKDSELYNEMERKLKLVHVDTIFLPHTEGISTTILTEIIRRKK
ncbi:MAG: adenylyltransferase/cytidyltransferase family protein [Synergistaceae bacterium]|nr:adenylyltransferase/cytidyltransferase family protein [Synergistaceae bacterium]